MRKLLFLLTTASAAALAQVPDDPSKRDKDEAARMRVDGAAGGTGNPVAKGEGKRDAIRGKTNREDLRPRQAKEGRRHDERSSDREAARGAR